MERVGIRAHRTCVPIGVCRDVRGFRTGDGLAWHEGWVCHRDCLVVAGSDGAFAGVNALWVWHCASVPGNGRSRQFPWRGQNHCGMVSEKRTRFGYGGFQCWHQCGRDDCADCRVNFSGFSGLAKHFHRHRRTGISLVDFLVGYLSATGRSSARCSRIRLPVGPGSGT